MITKSLPKFTTFVPQRQVFQTPPETPKTDTERPEAPEETDAKYQRVLESIRGIKKGGVKAETRDSLQGMRAEVGQSMPPGTPETAETTEPTGTVTPEAGTATETPETAAETPAGAPAQTAEAKKTAEKEKTDAAEKAAETGGPFGGALYNIFKKLGEKLMALFESLRLIPGAADSKKILGKLNEKTHDGFKDLADRETVKKNLDDTSKTASSTVEYIGGMLGVTAKDPEDLYLGLKNSRDAENKEKYTSTSSSGQKYPVGSILFFSAKLEGEKKGTEDTRRYGGKDVGAGLTHAAIVVKGGKLGELTLRFLNKDGYPKSEDATLRDTPFGVAGTPFGYENFVCALYSPKDLEAEKAEETKPAEETAETAETEAPATAPAADAQTVEGPETAAPGAEVQAAKPAPKAPETATPEAPSETQES